MDHNALIIGMDIYDNTEMLDTLPNCKKDALDLYDLLSSKKLGYSVFTDSPLIGSKLDKTYGWVTVRKAINDFFLDAKPGDTLLFYFSGHGITWGDEVYLATVQINPKKPLSGEGIPLSDLTLLTSRSKSKQIVCIIDACFSGALRISDSKMKSKAVKDNAEHALAIYDTVWKRTPKAEGRYLLLSSQGYGESFAPSDPNANSIYTKYIIEGLCGKENRIVERGSITPGSVDENGIVTPESLHQFVYFKVANIVDQIPKLKVDKSSNVILAYYPNLRKSKMMIFNIPGKVSEDKRMHKNYYMFENLHIYSAHALSNERSIS